LTGTLNIQIPCDNAHALAKAAFTVAAGCIAFPITYREILVPAQKIPGISF